jgi:ABC-type transport system involved in multi-copper enzyme maturation permease subunit
LILASIVLVAFAAIGLRTRIFSDEETLGWLCWPFALLLPLFATTGLIPTERGDGTFESLQALPISLRRIVIVKAATGAALCVLPLLAAMIVSLLIVGGREITDATMLEIYARAMLTSLMLFTWMFTSTIRLPTDARAAMVAIGIVMCWAMLSGAMTAAKLGILSTISPLSFLINRRFPIDLKYKFSDFYEWHPSFGLNLAIELAIAVVLLFLALRAVEGDAGSAAD